MAEVIEADRSGRIVIPKSLRQELGIRERTKFLLTNRGQGQLLLQKLDVDKIARRLSKELAGRDIDAIIARVKKEVDKKIRAQYPDLLA
jgi:AbrB family looped-hinge helix DNA binding protein